MKKIEDFMLLYKILFIAVALVSVWIFLAGSSLGIHVVVMIIVSLVPILLWLFLYFSYKAIYNHFINVRKAINEEKKL